MASGWRFSVTVPSWTQTTLEGDEIVVFYRVEVKVIPPDANAQPRCRSVLRRFSHFTKLHNKLREELGSKKMAGKEAPAKRTLFNVNRKPDLIERRRRELQQWLWRLIGDPDVARSKMLNDFLELSDAARLVQRPRSMAVAGTAGTDSVAEGSYAMSEGSSPRGDASSEASGFTSASILAPSVHGHAQMPSADFEASLDRFMPEASTSGQAMDTLRPLTASGTTSLAALETRGRPEEEDKLRLGLRVEQRGNVKRLVRSLKQRLDRASSDLQDAAATLQAERDAKRRLAEQVAGLEERMGADHTQREAELDRLLDQERSAAAGLRSSLEDSSTRNDSLSAQLLALQRSAASAAAEPAGPVGTSSRYEVAAGQADEVEGGASGSTPGALRERADGIEQAAEAQQREQEALQRAQAAESARDAAAADLAAAKQEADEVHEQLAAAKLKAKADLKLLAKEVKSLRKQLPDLERSRGELEQANAALLTAQSEAKEAAQAQQRLSEEVMAAQAQLSQAVSREQQLQADLTSLRAEKDQLAVEQAELSQVGTREQQLQAEVAALRASMEQLTLAQAELGQASAREQQLQADLAALMAEKSRLAVAQAELSQASAQEQSLQAELAAAKAATSAEAEERAEQFATMQTALQEAAARAEHHRAGAEQLRKALDMVQAAQAAQAGAAAQEQQSQAEISQLRADLGQMQEALKLARSAEEQVKEAAARERQSQAELSAAWEEMQRKQDAHERTQEAALKQAAAGQQLAEDERVALQQQLQQAQEARSALEAAAATQEQSQTQIAALQLELQQVKANLAQSQAAQEELLQTRNVDSQAELAALRAELQETKEALAQAQTAQAKLEEENPHAELSALQAELHQIEAEHSLVQSNELAEALAAAQQARAHEQDAVTERTALQAQLQDVQAKLQEVQAELQVAGAGGELADAQTALADARALEKQSQADLELACRDLARMSGELHARRSEVGAIRKELSQTRGQLQQAQEQAPSESTAHSKEGATANGPIGAPPQALSQPAAAGEAAHASESNLPEPPEAQISSAAPPVYDISEEDASPPSVQPDADVPASPLRPVPSNDHEVHQPTLSFSRAATESPADVVDPFLPMTSDQLSSLPSSELPTPREPFASSQHASLGPTDPFPRMPDLSASRSSTEQAAVSSAGTPGQSADPFLPMPQTSFASVSTASPSPVAQTHGMDPFSPLAGVDLLGDGPHQPGSVSKGSAEDNLGGLSPMSSSGVLETGALDLMSADLLSSEAPGAAAPPAGSTLPDPAGHGDAQKPDSARASNGIAHSDMPASAPMAVPPANGQPAGSGLLGRFLNAGAVGSAPATAAPIMGSPSPPGAMGSLMSKMGFSLPATARQPANFSGSQQLQPGAGQGPKTRIRPRAPAQASRTAASSGRPRPPAQSSQVQRGPESPKPRLAVGPGGDPRAAPASSGEGIPKPEEGSWNLAGGRLESFARGLMRKSAGSGPAGGGQ